MSLCTMQPTWSATRPSVLARGERAVSRELIDLTLSARRLWCVMLDYLQAAPISRWPGADGLTMDDALLEYLEAATAGRVPDREELQRRHPELSGDLDALFARSAEIVIGCVIR